MSRSIICLVLVCAMCACGGTAGDIVRITEADNSHINGLKAEDIEKLEEIKRTRETQPMNPTLSTAIEMTQRLSSSEYLMQYPKARGADGRDYEVGGYDVLSIRVYEEQDLSREAVRVSAEGYISFPLIGRVKVGGLTTAEIETRISFKLAEEEYLLDAHVSVMVAEFNSKRFLALGAVRNPGSYALQAHEKVLDAVSRAGGIDSSQAGKTGMIIRAENPKLAQENKVVITIDLQGLLKGGDQVSNLYIADRDILFIPTAEHFYIIGEVKNPGAYSITDRQITLVEAISMAGGFTPIAARNRTRIIRVESGVEKIIQVKVDAITDAGRKIQDVIVQPNDIIIVPESFF